MGQAGVRPTSPRSCPSPLITPSSQVHYGQYRWDPIPQPPYSYEGVDLGVDYLQDDQHYATFQNIDFMSITNYAPPLQAYNQPLEGLFPDPPPSSPMWVPLLPFQNVALTYLHSSAQLRVHRGHQTGRLPPPHMVPQRPPPPRSVQ